MCAKQLLVLGASSGISFRLFHHLDKSSNVKFNKIYAFARNVDKVKNIMKSYPNLPIESIQGDITNLDSLSALKSLEISHVVYTAGGYGFGSNSPYHVDYLGVKEVLKYIPCPLKFVYISSQGVSGTVSNFALNVSLGNYGKWKKSTEDLLFASKIPSVIIRPGWLQDHQRNSGIQFSQDDRNIFSLWGITSRDSIAEIILHSLRVDINPNTIFEVQDDPRDTFPQSDLDWDKVFHDSKYEKIDAK